MNVYRVRTDFDNYNVLASSVDDALQEARTLEAKFVEGVNAETESEEDYIEPSDVREIHFVCSISE